MDADRRLELINTWTTNENKIQDLVRQLEDAKALKEKIEEDIPSLRETGKWEIKFISPKRAEQPKKIVLPTGETTTKSQKRKQKTEAAIRKKMAKMAEESSGTILMDTGSLMDTSQDFQSTPKNL